MFMSPKNMASMKARTEAIIDSPVRYSRAMQLSIDQSVLNTRPSLQVLKALKELPDDQNAFYGRRFKQQKRLRSSQ